MNLAVNLQTTDAGARLLDELTTSANAAGSAALESVGVAQDDLADALSKVR